MKEYLSPVRWQERVQQAVERAGLIEELRARCPTGKPITPAIRAMMPGEPLTNVRRWLKWYDTREGEVWERLMDRRTTPKPWKTPEIWEAVVQGMGSQDLPPSCAEIRKVLVARFGQAASLCDSTIKRILKAAGLWAPYSSRSKPSEKVVQLNGGGALVPLLAASIETGALDRMAQQVSELARAQQSPDGPLPEGPEGRDERGQFTTEYNRKRLEMLDELGCTVYRSVKESRKEKDLSSLRLASLSSSTLAQHLRCIMALPLITGRRGTAGLDCPAGGWLEILSPVAYKTRTADKTLRELKLLGAAEVMWSSHAETWLELSSGWAGQGWRQVVDYIDATYDPWWTHRYAMSGKVSRTGRVQPCLARPMLSSGPGVPIIAHVVSGTVSLNQQLVSMLELADELRGEDVVGRLTVVDSECCTIDLLRHFKDDKNRDIITVIKGILARGKVFEPTGECMEFRTRDQLQDGEVNLEPGKAGGLTIRVVQMIRATSRHPKPTWFATTASKDKWTTQDVAEAYLSRWPNQEDLFRRGRNGAGLERSHGYGVSKVSNVAVIGKREKAGRQMCNAAMEVMQSVDAEAGAVLQLAGAEDRLAERRKREGPEKLDKRHELGVRQAKKRLKERRRKLKQTKRKQEKAVKEYEALRSTPDEIYVRDTELDSITTCFKMMLLAMLEFICQEYLGRKRIMPRTLVEAWMPLPVTVRTRRNQIIYEVAPNPRDPAMTALLAQVLESITQRKLRFNGKQVLARIRDGPG